ncbi:unnamed protein product [Echinostoma caproni]|uniref:Ferritin n=1 Tax=Echinostoma caproni TaxID=27848 RepID=A0A182ZZH5_9TREM|nr:unnamed protein product [Echinostoma caproni]
MAKAQATSGSYLLSDVNQSGKQAQECEQAINQLIQAYQSASHTYDHLVAACATEEMNMPGFCKFFRLCSLRTRRIAEHWTNWQTMRGGKLYVAEVKPLTQINDIWQQGIEKLLHIATELEKKMEQMVRQLHQIARSKEDVATAEIIEQKCLQHQYYVIRMMVNHENGLKLSQNAYLYDCTTMKPLVKRMHKFMVWHNEQMSCSVSSDSEKTHGTTSRHTTSSFEECPGVRAFMSSIWH